MEPVISRVGQRMLFLAASLAFASCGGNDLPDSRSTAIRLDSERAPTTVAGDFITHSTTTGVQQVGELLFVKQDVFFSVTGGLSGTASSHDTVIINTSTGTGVFHGSGTFTGTILGRSGTIGFLFDGTFTGYPTLPKLRGRIVFLPDTATGDLEGMHAHGTLEGIIDVGGTYAIEVGFGS